MWQAAANVLHQDVSQSPFYPSAATLAVYEVNVLVNGIILFIFYHYRDRAVHFSDCGVIIVSIKLC